MNNKAKVLMHVKPFKVDNIHEIEKEKDNEK